MAKKDYGWIDGAELHGHTEKKHLILREYFKDYLRTRCNYPTRSFKLVIVDGFAGGGKYENGSYGSPIIFVDVLQEVTAEVNTKRYSEGLPPVKIECLLYLNDHAKDVIELLKVNIAPFITKSIAMENLDIRVEYFISPFDKLYWEFKSKLKATKCNNVFFNLDQCGYSHVPTEIIRDIISSWKSAEVLLTFMIDSMLTYLSPKDENAVPMEKSVRNQIVSLSDEFNRGEYNKKAWLGKAERTIFEYLSQSAQFVSPFSINNPEGWRYWLMHFASSHRARQVFNNILHRDEATQAHYGRAGLNMLSYDPRDEMQLYLFNSDSRETAKNELYDDIPRIVSASGDLLDMDDFYKLTYNETPAHSDDIHEMMIANPDVEIITDAGGGERRKPHTIRSTDKLRLKKQQSLFFMYKQP
jgi:three-Cys-motif partner protein